MHTRIGEPDLEFIARGGVVPLRRGYVGTQSFKHKKISSQISFEHTKENFVIFRKAPRYATLPPTVGVCLCGAPFRGTPFYARRKSVVLLARVIITNIKLYTHGKSQRSEIFVNKGGGAEAEASNACQGIARNRSRAQPRKAWFSDAQSIIKNIKYKILQI